MTKFRDVDKGWKKLGRMLQKQRFAGPHVNVGVQGPSALAAHAQGETTVVEIASYHEFGRGHNPERSFIRETFDINQFGYAEMMRKLADQVVTGRRTPKFALSLVGMKVESDIKRRIEAGIPPPLSPVTIARKGSSKQLVDSGQLKSSITHAVEVPL